MEKEIRTIPWQETIPIRHQVLWPNESPAFCMLADDDQGWHFGYYLNGRLVSVASIYFDVDRARLRKFATLPALQGRGIGTELLSHVLKALKEKAVTYLWCDARESAIGFYQRLGLQQEGARFHKSGVAYSKMSVRLN